MKRPGKKTRRPSRLRRRCLRAVLVGLGNIGSVAADLVARSGVDQITLIDHGSYEARNLVGQRITRSAVGRPKATVVAEHLRRVNPGLSVEPIAARLQDVPPGLLRSDVMLTGLDSRLARAYANQAARWLGVTLIDAGVEASQLLARVSVCRAGPDAACLQCSWSDRDYEVMEVPNPCRPEGDAPSTNAPAALGALAASLMAIELKKVLEGDSDSAAAGRQITYCAVSHRSFVTTVGTSPRCRCDHSAWRIGPLGRPPESYTLGQALRPGRSLSVPGKTFLRALVCAACGARRKVLRLEGRLTRRQLACPRCGEGMLATGFDQLDRLDLAALGAKSPLLGRPLARLGLRGGDVLRIETAGGERYLEIDRTDRGAEKEATKEVCRA